MEAANKKFSAGRCLLAWFEDHGIPRDQRGNDMAGRKVCGRIERRDDSHDTVWLVADCCRAFQCAVQLSLRGAFGICLNGNFDFVDDPFDFRACFPDGLARFAGYQTGQCFGLLAHFVGEASQQFHSPGERLQSPIGPGVPSPGDRGFKVAGFTSPDFLAGRRFIRDDRRGFGRCRGILG